MRFADVIGQEEIKRKLVQSSKAGRISHAQLFLGASGYGSLALALAYAQYLNCEDVTEDDSCGKCPNCQKMYKLIHPDVHFSFPIVATKKAGSEQDDPQIHFYEEWRKYIHETAYPSYQEWIKKIGTENQQGNIPIAEARSIIRKLSLKSYQGGLKILIMWLPEFLGVEGNVLLKVLEEPTPNTIFLLVAEDRSKILNTILSRTQVVRIPRIRHADLVSYLEKECAADHNKAVEAASLSAGNVRRALEVLQSGEEDFFEAYVNWMRMCFTKDLKGLLLQSQEWSGMPRETTKNFLGYSVNLFRESLLLSQGLQDISMLQGEQLEWVKNKFAPNLPSADKSTRIICLIEEAHYFLERNANPKIILFDLSLKINSLLR